MSTFFSAFHPAEVTGAKGSAAFLGSITSALVYLYKRSASAPAGPNNDTIYTFATANVDVSAITNGWTATIPAGTDPLYVVAASAVGTNATDTIPNTEWSSPVILSQNGSIGTNGLNSATVYLYQRNDTGTPPSVPSTTSTYTFSTAVLTGYDNGWAQSVPGSASGKYLFVTTATAASTSATDTIATGEWASPTVMAQDGDFGLTVYLTNEQYNVPAYFSGVVKSYSGCTGQFIVYNTETNTDVSSNFTLSTSSNPQSLTVNYTGNTYTVSAGLDAGENSAVLIITATGSGAYSGVSLSKTFTIGKSIDGTPAVSGYITNESSVVFTYADGTPVDFNTANGHLKLFDGVTDVTSSATSFSATASGCTGTINTADNTPVSGQVKGYYRITAMSSDTATLTVAATYGGVTITKIFALTKAKAGYEIVGTLPATNLFQGRTVFLTSDNKLYRYTGSAWVTSVPAADISGTITTTQITDDAITTAKIAANAVTATEIATDTITASQIAAGAITANEIATGTITAAEIASNTITAVKLNISSLDAITATIGLLRTATSGARMEIENNVIRVYDTAGTLRVKIGNLA